MYIMFIAGMKIIKKNTKNPLKIPHAKCQNFNVNVKHSKFLNVIVKLSTFLNVIVKLSTFLNVIIKLSTFINVIVKLSTFLNVIVKLSIFLNVIVKLSKPKANDNMSKDLCQMSTFHKAHCQMSKFGLSGP